uniref:Uncharacterized protein n=1 Tax=Oryza glaberrima TaxID=4538 RepID=I1PA47_ORYGL
MGAKKLCELQNEESIVVGTRKRGRRRTCAEGGLRKGIDSVIRCHTYQRSLLQTNRPPYFIIRYCMATTTTVDGGDDGMVEDPSKAGSPVPIAAVRSGGIDSRRLVAAAAKMAPRRQSLPRSLVLRKVMTLDYLMTMRQSSLPPALLSYPLHPPRHQPSYHRRKRADSSTMRGSAWR